MPKFSDFWTKAIGRLLHSYKKRQPNVAHDWLIF